MVASHLGMMVSDLLERMTHRELLGWLAYLSTEVERPSKTEWYLMQLTKVLWSTKFPGDNVKVNDFKLVLGEPSPSTVNETKTQNLSRDKASWFAVAGRGRTVSKEERQKIINNYTEKVKDHGSNRRTSGPTSWR